MKLSTNTPHPTPLHSHQHTIHIPLKVHIRHKHHLGHQTLQGAIRMLLAAPGGRASLVVPATCITLPGNEAEAVLSDRPGVQCIANTENQTATTG